MKVAFITLSVEGAEVVKKAMKRFKGAHAYIHKKADANICAQRFERVTQLTEEIFNDYDGLVYVAPTGAVIRALAPMIKSKISDPAVVVLDVGARYAVSLLSGHEGGANDLSFAVANAVGAQPVISTTTEAVKDIIIGIGCRKGKEKEKIIEAINIAIDKGGVAMEQVRTLVSADVKIDETGLLDAAKELGLPIQFISSTQIRSLGGSFKTGELVEKSVNLPAVAEPAALLACTRATLILNKLNLDGITAAIAKEELI
jgi:cobalt-precorrin 5A hydrolase